MIDGALGSSTNARNNRPVGLFSPLESWVGVVSRKNTSLLDCMGKGDWRGAMQKLVNRGVLPSLQRLK